MGRLVGILAALCTLGVWAAPASAQRTGPALNAVVISGDASPDGDGAFGLLGVPSINDAGDVSFRANLTGTLSAQGIFVDRSAGLHVVARAGDTAPDGNGEHAGFALGPVPINAAGEVAFQSGVSGTSGGAADNAGVFISGQPNRQIVRKGQASPDANGAFASFLSVGIEDRGAVTLWAAMSGTAGGPLVDDRGVYRGVGGSGDVTGPLDQLLRMGLPVSAGSATGFGNVDPSLASHRSGWVAIRSFLDDAMNPGPSDLAIFVDDGQTRSQRFQSRDLSPDGDGSLFSFPTPFVGADGSVASHVTFDASDGGLADNMGLVAYPAFGSPGVLAREGDAAPEDGTLAVDFTDALAYASTLVAPSRMAFHAFLSGTSGGGGTDDRGLFLATPAGVMEIVRRGDLTPELDGEFDDFRFGRLHVSSAGRVVFFAEVRNASNLGAGIFTRSPTAPVATIARIGQPLLGSTIQSIEILTDEQARLAGVSAMNAFGDITFWLRLADRREAIIATVPEASTPLLAGAALAVLAALGCVRRRVSVPAPRPLAVAVVAFVLGQASPAAALVVDRVVVGDPGNAADTTSHGAVATSFYIGTTEVSNAQYVEFLNAMDPSGTNPLALWDPLMMNNSLGGIDRDGAAPAGMKYEAKPGREDLSVNFVSWYDAIRLANWLHNGQGTGDTESGAYTLLGGTATPSNGTSITRNAGAHVWIPSEDEWYKAAYYDGNGYLQYPTASNTAPTPELPPGGSNSANYANAVLDLTTVGAYPAAMSPYGTLDQGGNLWELNEDKVLATARRMRGGSFGTPAVTLSKAVPSSVNADAGFVDVGFRLAFASAPPSPPPPGVPALSAPLRWLLGLLLAAGGARFMRR